MEACAVEHLIAYARTVLSTTPARWQQLTDTLPAELLTRKPAPGEWSAFECLGHLLDTERFAFPVRVRAFLAGQNFPSFDPDAEGSHATPRPPTQLAAEFAQLRAESLALLAGVTEADLPRTAQHPDLGLVTLDQMLHEWAAHDLNHTLQAERALMQPFIAGSGPWRFYFAAHDVEPARGS
jgi:DinB family protein